VSKETCSNGKTLGSKTDVYGKKATYHLGNEIYVYAMRGTYVKGDA